MEVTSIARGCDKRWPKLRAGALQENLIVDGLPVEDSAHARYRPRCPGGHVARGGAKSVTAAAGRVRHSVADDFPASAATLGVQKIHESRADAQARQQRPA